MAARNLANDRQSQAGTRLLAGLRGTPEAVEHLGDVLSRNPGSVIAHRHLSLGDLHLDLTATWTPFACVVEQVRDRALETLGVALHHGRPRINGEAHVGEMRSSNVNGTRSQFIESHVGAHQAGGRVPTCEVDEIGNEPAEPLQLTGYVSQQLITLFG